MNKNEIKNILLIFLFSFFYYKQKTEVDYYLGGFLEKMINMKTILNNVLNIFKKNKIIENIENKNDDDNIILDLDIPKTTKKSINFLWKYLIILSILIVTKFKTLLLNKKNNKKDENNEQEIHDDNQEIHDNQEMRDNSEEIHYNEEIHDNQEEIHDKNNNEEKHDNNND